MRFLVPFLALLMTATAVGCARDFSEAVPVAEVKTPTVAAAPAWDPLWTSYVKVAIDDHSPELLSPSAGVLKEVDRVCPGFRRAGKSQRVEFWGAFFAAIARYESNFDPTARMQEDWADPETGKPQMSEGLLQLSYSDRQGHPDCRLDRSKGNIVDPQINLSCGVAILRRQLQVKGTLFPGPKPYYWSVLSSRKIQPKLKAYLASATSTLSACQKAEL